MGGKLLEISLNETVFGMGGNINTSGATGLGDTIDTLWKLIRDICNLAFIFGFIYVGIRTIIDPASASTKRFLSRIIIGALLINFSLFFAKAIIDFSNFTAHQVYTSMVTGDGSLTETIMNKLNLITFYDSKSGKMSENMANSNSLSYFLVAGLFLLITAFTFFAAALLLIVRFVTLILIMVASPILFAATVFPQTERFAGDLWKKLFSQSFLAPVYLLLVLISIKLIEGVGFASGGNFGKDLSSLGNNLSAILNFTIIIFFMVSSLTLATKMGGKGGEMAVSFANNLRGKAQSVIGRNTLGRASHWAREKYEKLDANAKTADNKTWRGVGLKTLRTGIVAATLGERNLRGGLSAGEHAKFGGKYSFEDDEKYDKERKARQGKIIELSKFTGEIKKGVDENGKLQTLSPEDSIKFERTVADAAVKDFEELKQEQRKAIVGLMTDSQIEAIQKSDKLTDTEKVELGTERQTFVANLYAGGKVGNLSKAAVGHLSTLGHKFLSQPEHAVRLNSSQMDDLKKKMTLTEFKSLSDAREQALENIANGKAIQTVDENGNVTYLNHEFIIKQKPGEIAKMPKKVLEPITKFLPTAALENMVRQGTMSQPDQKALLAKIDSEGSEEQKKWINDSPTGRLFGK
jgi:hypothetical protein